ncbi:MAG: glycine cleavage system aminomethyltransferase GcvT, partial [Clostridiales bacterium]|nr:glycine cleavage system aminomethyltransferase GcvT [Clostridiales bacterium]
PLQYKGIIEEHTAVRKDAGLFDVSHMGEISIEGDDSISFLQRIITNDVSRLGPYQIMYSPICYPHGGIVDDVLIYKYSDSKFLMVTNAANTLKDYNWLLKNISGNVKIEDVSKDFALLAIQGPKAERILSRITDYDLSKVRFFRFVDKVNIDGIEAMVSRTGYTGEDGFEIYLSPECAPLLWEKLLHAGKDMNLMAAGLGARDTLRLEAALPLYGNEISEDITPLEGGLQRFVRLTKGDFIGRDSLMERQDNKVQRKLIGCEILDRGIIRQGYKVFKDDKEIGYITSGGHSPSLNKSIGMAIIDAKYACVDQDVYILARKRMLRARIVGLPFYKKT